MRLNCAKTFVENMKAHFYFVCFFFTNCYIQLKPTLKTKSFYSAPYVFSPFDLFWVTQHGAGSC